MRDSFSYKGATYRIKVSKKSSNYWGDVHCEKQDGTVEILMAASALSFEEWDTLAAIGIDPHEALTQLTIIEQVRRLIEKGTQN